MSQQEYLTPAPLSMGLTLGIIVVSLPVIRKVIKDQPSDYSSPAAAAENAIRDAQAVG